MRTLFIGDVHNRYEMAEDAIEKIPHDNVVLVGDYFDSWDDGRGQARKTAEWLVESLTKPNRIHLWGNHDVPYYRSQSFSCPGWEPRKDEVINYVMSDFDWQKIKFYTWVDGEGGDWFISHAGIHPSYIPSYHVGDLAGFKVWLDNQEKGAWQALNARAWNKHWFWDRGQGRSGDDMTGGILWQHWDTEFSGTFFNQICGHTPNGTQPIRKYDAFMSTNYCVDGLWGACLVLDNGKPEIYTKQLTNDGSFVKVETIPE
jgi:hypothetical protein